MVETGAGRCYNHSNDKDVPPRFPRRRMTRKEDDHGLDKRNKALLYRHPQ